MSSDILGQCCNSLAAILLNVLVDLCNAASAFTGTVRRPSFPAISLHFFYEHPGVANFALQDSAVARVLPLTTSIRRSSVAICCHICLWHKAQSSHYCSLAENTCTWEFPGSVISGQWYARSSTWCLVSVIGPSEVTFLQQRSVKDHQAYPSLMPFQNLWL